MNTEGVTRIEIKEEQQTDMEPIDFFVNLKYQGGCELKLCQNICIIRTIMTNWCDV